MLTLVGTLTVFLAVAGSNALLVETDALTADQKYQIVDSRPVEAYTEAHIPGALHLDTDSLSEERDGVPGMLRPAKDLQAVVQAKGLRPDKTIVIYSDMAQPSDTKRATRLFWILEYLGFSKVAVLNGGFAKWTAEGRDVESGAPAIAETPAETFELTVRPELLAGYEDIIKAIHSGETCLLDLRSSEEYTGLKKHSFQKEGGHISGASNLEAGVLVEAQEQNGVTYYTFTGSESMKQDLESAIGDWNRPVTTYCNSGRDATVGYFGLRMEGHNNISVYDGSMLEWSQKSGATSAE